MKKFINYLMFVISVLACTNINAKEMVQLSFDKETYDCSDKITLRVILTELERDDNSLTVLWRNPFDEVQENVSFDVKANNNMAMVNTWLNLHRGKGSGIFQAFDSTAGFSDFIGEWNVQVKVNGRKRAESKFVVQC